MDVMILKLSRLLKNHICRRDTPVISIHSYIIRLCKYYKLDVDDLRISWVYFQRLLLKNMNVVSKYNIYHLFAVITSVNLKYNHDIGIYSNRFYSQVAGLGLKQFNYLEVEFLYLIDWNLNISTEDICGI